MASIRMIRVLTAGSTLKCPLMYAGKHSKHTLPTQTPAHETSGDSANTTDSKHSNDKQSTDSELPAVIGFDAGFRDGYQAGFEEGRRRIQAMFAASKKPR
ncbi:hypothetical protein LPJ78_002832 [Coemansia sp. RSA 989]|nr:hypothetical protein LPJ78_002832 [Coemansia sp. RSA 989]KAJ1872638.1 hypothetical protein LPJ55_002938 [Coemansia sp. RSA 990]